MLDQIKFPILFSECLSQLLVIKMTLGKALLRVIERFVTGKWFYD